MNILMFTRSMCMDGVTTCVIDFSNCLHQKGHNVSVCGKRDTETYRLEEGVSFFDVNFYVKTPWGILKNISKLCKVVKEQKIDVIHCHWRFTTIYAQIVHLLTGVDTIWQNHLIPIPHSFFYRLMTFYGKKAVAISYDGSVFLHEKLRIPEKKIKKINNGIDLKKYRRITDGECVELRKQYGIQQDEKVIVLFARLAAVKGHKFLLDAAKKLQLQYKLIFTGESDGTYKQELEQYIKECDLEEKVIFTGNVTANEILSIADVMVLPSKIEGFPIAVIEAFALRVPVVRTKEGGYEDVKDCVDGVQYGDVNTLAELLEKNLSMGDEIKQRVERAYKKAVKTWDLNVVIDSYLDVYAER